MLLIYFFDDSVTFERVRELATCLRMISCRIIFTK